MSIEPAPGQPYAPLAERLGYLLKHAQLRMAELTEAALAPYGVDGREWATLIALDDREPLSQRQVARRLDVDRTTMVALVDGLEGKGLVERRQHPADRRKNVVALTATGRDTLEKATRAGDDAERRLLAALPERDAERLKVALGTLVTATIPPFMIEDGLPVVSLGGPGISNDEVLEAIDRDRGGR